jgi:hypothetical protein
MSTTYHVMDKIQMASENVASYLRSGVFQASGADAEVFNGAIVELGAPRADATYASTGISYELVNVAAPAAVTDKRIGIVDLSKVEALSDGSDNEYRIGSKLYNLSQPAGKAVRVRMLQAGDRFWIGQSGLTLTAGQFAILTAGSTQLAAAAAAPESGLYCRVVMSKPLIAGQQNIGTEYYLEVVSL